jgi:hypothetical protein
VLLVRGGVSTERERLCVRSESVRERERERERERVCVCVCGAWLPSIIGCAHHLLLLVRDDGVRLEDRKEGENTIVIDDQAQCGAGSSAARAHQVGDERACGRSLLEREHYHVGVGRPGIGDAEALRPTRRVEQKLAQDRRAERSDAVLAAGRVATQWNAAPHSHVSLRGGDRAK